MIKKGTMVIYLDNDVSPEASFHCNIFGRKILINPLLPDGA